MNLLGQSNGILEFNMQGTVAKRLYISFEIQNSFDQSYCYQIFYEHFRRKLSAITYASVYERREISDS